MNWTIYPAIDVRGGRVVRLAQGDYSRETVHGEDPLALAAAFSAAGAQWLHLVDLDAARSGAYGLRTLLQRIVKRTRLKVQTGGGIRDESDVESLFEAGAARVVIGTLAVRQPGRVIGWLKEFGAERIVVALDTRLEGGRWCLPVRGWTEASVASLDELLMRFRDAGLRHLLCTDIARDGMLAGFNLELYEGLQRRFPGIELQASGGVSDVAQIARAREAGLAGAVLGRALLEGRIALPEALAC
ncbi:1-(5-phosphoribosyl)-5-[(5-phosphoribosylamino)methylideneamino]imidazole-4-carboxamide isomerase [Arenimonas sp.]|uniref:1-(5-phosphoribosyl)-5-[(5- phosphoribosylamino)methylideneamino]imidazole-4- carboxamide isomerase n=1 Tax=Arenimonas sp. TaxID=1872635 RepID=UPI0039E3747D